MARYFDENGAEVDPFAPAEQENTTPAWRRDMESRLSKAQESHAAASARADAAERSLAFAQAGVPLDNPQAQWFVKGYDGDMTAEAIRAAAAPLGFTQQQNGLPPEEAAAHQRMADAAAGGTVAGARDYDAEMRAAAAQNDKAGMNRILVEKHQALGLPGQAIVDG